MNDYLTSLAARALAQSSPIVPRTGSLFEPTAARSLVKSAPNERRGADFQQGESLEVESQGENRRAKVPAAAVRPVEQAPSKLQDPVTPAVHFHRPQVFPQPSREPPALQTAAVAAPATVAPPRPFAMVSITASPQALAITGREPRERAAVTPPDRSREPPHEKTRRDELPADANSPSKQSRAPQPLPKTEPVRPMIVPTVTVAPAPSPQPGAALPLQRQTEPPIIRVTIGRVDVRAITSPPVPAAAARSPGRATRLSLDDYLKERSGGRR